MEITLRTLASVLPYRRARTFLGRPGIEAKCPVCGSCLIAWEALTGGVGYQCEKCQPESVASKVRSLIRLSEMERRLASMRDRMIAIALKIVGNTDDAEEVVQEAFLSVIENEPEEWGINYVSTIVQRRSVDKVRRRRPIVSLNSIPDDSSVFAVDDRISLPDEEMRKLMDSLPLHERILIEAVADSEGGLSGAALSLGVSEQALKSELHRVRKRFTSPCKAREPQLF